MYFIISGPSEASTEEQRQENDALTFTQYIFICPEKYVVRQPSRWQSCRRTRWGGKQVSHSRRFR